MRLGSGTCAAEADPLGASTSWNVYRWISARRSFDPTIKHPSAARPGRQARGGWGGRTPVRDRNGGRWVWIGQGGKDRGEADPVRSGWARKAMRPRSKGRQAGEHRAARAPKAGEKSRQPTAQGNAGCRRRTRAHRAPIPAGFSEHRAPGGGGLPGPDQRLTSAARPEPAHRQQGEASPRRRWGCASGVLDAKNYLRRCQRAWRASMRKTLVRLFAACRISFPGPVDQAHKADTMLQAPEAFPRRPCPTSGRLCHARQAVASQVAG